MILGARLFKRRGTLGRVRLKAPQASNMQIGGGGLDARTSIHAALNQGAVQRNHKGAGLDPRLIACGSSNHQTEFQQGNGDMQ
jgi:hypothetical protein